jgi:uncharacterized protein (TIGR01777 family)
MHIVIAGGTGFLGAALVDRLRRDGHRVTVLTRHPHAAGDVKWDPVNRFNGWVRSLDDADAVINLAGESIAGRRWTAARKAVLRDSRVLTTDTLVDAMARASRIPTVLINASAVGIYGPRGDEPLTEESATGSDFLASLCQVWEAAALSAPFSTRVVLLRTGLVLEQNGGALPRMAWPFHLMAGGPLGSGRQYMPWIHRTDWVAMVAWALTTPTVSGPLNVTAPNPVTNREFATTLGRVLQRPSLLPAPAFALRLVLGEMADAIVTGQRAVPAKAQSLGFRFRYELLEPALRAIYGRT